MARETLDRITARIVEHVQTHRLPAVAAVLHGGEPLLAGREKIVYFAEGLRRAVDVDVDVDVSIQTNGVRLDADWITLLRRHSVRVGVSIDGDADAHDRHRRMPNGRGSHHRVAAALRKLSEPENALIYSGLLCTIDLNNDPVRVYESLLEHRPPMIDFLLPEANWSSPPPLGDGSRTPYAKWLIAVFERWYDHPVKETTIRYFDDVISLLLGGRAVSVGASTAPVASIVVETDGSIRASDALTATAPHLADTGLTVFANSFDDALQTPLVRQMQGGERVLARACRACSIMGVCGGGVHSQRFRSGEGFHNPSVYCADLAAVIGHIRRRIGHDIELLARQAATAP